MSERPLAAPADSALGAALAALLARMQPDAPASLLAATRLLVALDMRGHTQLPLHDGGRAALVEAGLQDVPWAGALPVDAVEARRDWAGSALVSIDPVDRQGASPLVLQGTALALRRHWDDERRAAQHLVARLQRSDGEADNEPSTAQQETLLAALFQPRAGATGPDAQRLAAARAAQGLVTVVTGGPGTGKTWTAARMLVMLQALHGAEPLRMALAAPTGKAAARLRQSIESALRALQDPVEPALAAACDAVGAAVARQPARTLHATLGVQPGSRRFVHGAARPLAVDLLLVDEASMVHGEMLAALLEALPAKARLVLLGDRDQLASVEAGAVMAELCDPTSPLAPQTVTLTAGHRFEGPIAALAAAVNRGDGEAAQALLSAEAAAEPVLQRLGAQDPAALLALARGTRGHGPFMALLRERPEDPAVFEAWVAELLRRFDGFRLLTAVRDGPFGSAALNARLTEALGERVGDDGWHEGRPVMVTRNDTALGVFNGDVGVALTPPGSAARRVWFLDGPLLRSVAAARLSAVETAWAMTVHKSQGSEFGHVALVLPSEDGPVLTRELVYTGITRARQALTLACPQPALLGRALQRRTRRFSGLGQALRAAAAAAADGAVVVGAHPDAEPGG